MKMKALIIWVVILTLTMNVFAKEGKLKFGKYIYYTGNIVDGKMNGSGTLYIKAKIGQKNTLTDEITGIFENNKITSCCIKFGSGWTYKGEASVAISENDNELRLLLNNGVLTTRTGLKLSKFSNLQYSIKYKSNNRFWIEFNNNSPLSVEISNCKLAYEIEPVLFYDNISKGSLISRKINETGKFQGNVSIKISNGNISEWAPFRWELDIQQGRFIAPNGNYYDITGHNYNEYYFNDILIKENGEDYILYGGSNSQLQKNCGRYIKKIRKTVFITPTDSIVLEGDRKLYNKYSPYVFDGKILFADNEYFEGEFKFNCETSTNFETFLNNLKESDISIKNGKYHYNNTEEIWQNRECIRPTKIIEAGEELRFNITIEKPNTILAYLPLYNLDKIDSLTITGFLYETDIAIINRCKYLRYLDLSRTFITYSPQAKQQEINEQQAAIAMAKLLGVVADLSDTKLSTSDYVMMKAIAELGNLADEHKDELKQIKQANENCIIPQSAFNNMKFLKTVKLPITAIAIEEKAFWKCEILDSVQLPPYLKSISKLAFAECINLKNLNFPPTITEIEKTAFQGCISLKKVDLSKNVLSNSDLSLSKGEGMEIRLPNNETSYFNYNKNCTIYYPSSLTRIGGKIYNCELHFSSPIPPIFVNDRMYDYEIKDNKIYIPKGSLTAYFTTFGEKNTYVEE